jgi:hypothetical protein
MASSTAIPPPDPLARSLLTLPGLIKHATVCARPVLAAFVASPSSLELYSHFKNQELNIYIWCYTA